LERKPSVGVAVEGSYSCVSERTRKRTGCAVNTFIVLVVSELTAFVISRSQSAPGLVSSGATTELEFACGSKLRGYSVQSPILFETVR